MLSFFSKNKSKLILIFSYFIIFSLVPLLWFKDGMILIGHDNIFPLSIPDFLRDRLFTWSENHGTGYDQSAVPGSIFIHIIDSIPYYLGFDLQKNQKIVYVFWFFALLFSSFLLSLFLEKKRYVTNGYFKYIFPVFYTYNFYVLQAWWIGERTKFSLMVALPLMLIVAFSLKEKSSNTALLAIFSVGILTIFNGGGFFGLPLYGGLLIVLASFFIYYSFLSIINKDLAFIKKIIRFFILFIPLFLLVNAYRILPFLSHTFQRYSNEIARIGGAENTFGWLDVVSRDASLGNLFRFQGIPEWYTSFDHPYGQFVISNPFFIILSFVFPFLILLSFLFKKNKQEKTFFFFLVFSLIFSILFTAGSHEPTGYLYKFLTVHIPGFAIFRSPFYKFGYALWFSGGMLIAYSLANFISAFSKLFSFGKFASFFTLLAVICLLAGYHYPYFTGNFFEWNNGRLANRVKVPDYIFQVSSWAKSLQDDSRILLLPESNTNWNADVYTWKFYSLYSILADTSRKPFLYNHDGLTQSERNLLLDLYSAILSGNNKIIISSSQILGVKYFIVRNDYFYTLDWSPTTDPKAYTQAITGNSLFSYNQSFGKWDVYTLNTSVIPKVYATSAIATYNFLGNSSSQINFLDLYNIDYHFSESFNKTFIASDKAERYKAIKNNIKRNYEILDCVNCNVMQEKIEVQFPDFRILPTSPLYALTNRVRNYYLKTPDGQEDLSNILGLSNIRVQEIARLSKFYQSIRDVQVSEKIIDTSNKLLEVYNHLEKLIEKNNGSIEYSLSQYPTIIAYFSAQEELLDAIIFQNNDKEYADNLVKVMNRIKQIKFPLEKSLSILNPTYSKYFFTKNKGTFEALLFSKNVATLKNALESEFEFKTEKLERIENENFIDLGNVFVKNNGLLKIKMNETKDDLLKVVEYYHPQEAYKNNCIGKTVEVDKNSRYRAELSFINSENEVIKIVVFPINNSYKKYLYSQPLFSKLITTSKKRIISQLALFNSKNESNVFVGICDIGLNAEDIKNKSLDIKIYNLYYPILVLEKEHAIAEGEDPKVTFKKINQTKYAVTVISKNPYFLNFNEKFDTDWKAYVLPSNQQRSFERLKSTDTIIEDSFFDTWFADPISSDSHFIGNSYFNTWYVNKTGKHEIIIEYDPQRELYKGAIVSIVAIFGIGTYLLLVFIKYVVKK